MAVPTTYEIVLRGRPSRRLLRPLLDDFEIDATGDSVTRLVGDIGDPAHLHGVVVHLTSVNLEIVSIAPAPRPQPDAATTTTDAATDAATDPTTDSTTQGTS